MTDTTWVPDTNDQRADRAELVLEAYALEHDQGEPTYEVVSDLVTDLMHLCDRYGLDFYKDVLYLSQVHHLAEVDEGDRASGGDPDRTWGHG